jgi:hypothetical protein
MVRVSEAGNKANSNDNITDRPVALAVNAKMIPDALKAQPQWVVWKYTWNPNKKRKDGSGEHGDWDKPLYCARTGRRASTTDPGAWTSYDNALAAYRASSWDGIGVVLTQELGIVGIDLDRCRDAQTGAVEQWAQTIIDAAGSYTEVSPSSTGIRIIAFAAKPTGRCRKDGVEMYVTGRYLTITGHHLEGTETRVLRRPNAIARLHRELFGTAAAINNGQQQHAPTAVKLGAGLNDDEIIAKAKSAKGGAKFKELWDGGLAGHKSNSEADLALCNILAFWTGPDPARIDRLFRQSGLMRPKWDRDDYRDGTIATVLAGRTDFYRPARAELRNTTGKDKPTQAQLVVDLALAESIELFHDAEHKAYATVQIEDHRENHRIRSRSFGLWLRRLFHERFAKPVSSQPLQDAMNTLEGKAVFDGALHQVAVRLAGHGAAIYLDLGDSDWNAVKITAGGWEVISNPRAMFIRPRGMLALPMPVEGGSIDELREFINIGNDDNWRMLVAFIVCALRTTGPYPLLVLHGEQGSAKSTLARMVRALLDPNTAPLRSEPKEPRDLMIGAANSWLLTLDNLSDIKPWLSDALCRLSTGGGFATRELFTDAEEVVFDAQRPIIITGIEQVAARPDLLDRSFPVNLPAIKEDQYRPEAELWAEFEQAKPHILGALLDAASCALRRIDKVKMDAVPRMADAAKWVTAAEPALG